MAYCTIDDIKNRLQETDLAQLTDDTGAGTLSTTKVDAAIAAADARINGYLRFRYTLPLAAVPEEIRDISIHLTIYELYNRKQSLLIPDQLIKDRAEYLKLLEDIRDGKYDPGVTDDTGAPIGTGPIAVCSKSADDTHYGDDLWAGYP